MKVKQSVIDIEPRCQASSSENRLTLTSNKVCCVNTSDRTGPDARRDQTAAAATARRSARTSCNHMGKIARPAARARVLLSRPARAAGASEAGRACGVRMC